jgi:hypothetical protein
MEGLRLLHAAGFAVGITRQITPEENPAAVLRSFRQLLRKQRLPEDLPIIALPELGLPNAADLPVAIVPAAPGQQVAAPACRVSRMLMRKNGQLRFHACPLTDDVPRFDLGANLETALAAKVMADHIRCAQCRGPGVDYAGAVATS